MYVDIKSKTRYKCWCLHRENIFANNGGGMKDMLGLTDTLQILSGPFDRKQEG